MAFLALAVLFLVAQAVHAVADATELMKHCEFFDQNKDGILMMPETIEGFKAIGVGAVEASASAVTIHTALSAKTRPGQPFDKDFPIVIENINLAKHTSDSGVYDDDGSFVPDKFEAIFTNHAHTDPNALTSDEVDEFVKANRAPGDFKNWLAAETEWKLLYKLGKDDNGLLQKQTIRNVYDGSLFYELANKHSNKK